MQRLLRELDQIQQLHVLKADYEKSLALLAALKAGEVSLDQVTLVANGWQVSAAEPVVKRPQAVPVECPEDLVAEASEGGVINLPNGGTVTTDADGKVNGVFGAGCDGTPPDQQ